MTTTRANLFTILLTILAVGSLAGCELGGGYYDGYTTVDPAPTPSGPVVSHNPGAPAPAPAPSPVFYVGDIALTVYAPAVSPMTPNTVGFDVTVRKGSAFGPIVLQGYGYHFDAYGVGVLDLAELPYGLYDIEIVGKNAFGDSVSFAATSIALEAPFVSAPLSLEPVTLAGDVVLELYEPDGGMYGPIDTIDYILWELDPTTGQYTMVEQIAELPAGPLDTPVIAALQLGTYYIEVDAYDVYGYRIYSWAGDFDHTSQSTFLPVAMWYAE